MAMMGHLLFGEDQVQVVVLREEGYSSPKTAYQDFELKSDDPPIIVIHRALQKY